MCCTRNVNYFQRFVDAGIHPLTARQKGYLALRNTVDPYNFATIGFFSGHLCRVRPAFGLWSGFSRLRPQLRRRLLRDRGGRVLRHLSHSCHRPPGPPLSPHAQRLLYTPHLAHNHAVGWAQSDYGVGMPNYSTLITTVVGDGLGNLYVPGREKSWGSAAARDVTAIATDPIGNIITEFLPDVARRVNVHIVLVQQIVNQVETQEAAPPQPAQRQPGSTASPAM